MDSRAGISNMAEKSGDFLKSSESQIWYLSLYHWGCSLRSTPSLFLIHGKVVIKCSKSAAGSPQTCCFEAFPVSKNRGFLESWQKKAGIFLARVHICAIPENMSRIGAVWRLSELKTYPKPGFRLLPSVAS